MKLTNHLDGGKAAQLVNMLLHLIANDTDANTLLTATGQIGYNQTTNRAILRTASAIRNLLTNADIYAGDLRDDATAPTAAAAEAKATALAIKSLETYLMSVINNNAITTEAFDASTATQFPTGATPNKRYRVTAAGTVQGVVLGIGDVFYAGVTSPSPTNATHWVFVQANVDAATSSIFGLVKLAASFTSAAELTALNSATPSAAATVNNLMLLYNIFQNETAAAFSSRFHRSIINIVVGLNIVVPGISMSPLSAYSVHARTAAGESVALDWYRVVGQEPDVESVRFNSLIAIPNVTIEIVRHN